MGQLNRTSVGVLASLLLLVLGFGAGLLYQREEEWKPSGDGKTIINTTTGEIRYTSTGETAQQYAARRQAEIQTEQEYQQRRQDAENQQREREQAARLAAEQRRLRELEESVERYLAIEAANGQHFHAIQMNVFRTSESEIPRPDLWRGFIKPYLADEFPSKFQRDEFAVFIVEGMHRGELAGEKWRDLLEHLHALSFDDDGTGTMKRTQEQLLASKEKRNETSERARNQRDLEVRDKGIRLADAEKEHAESLAQELAAKSEWRRLRNGLTRDQVEALLGAPSTQELDAWEYSYSFKMSPFENSGYFTPTGRIEFLNRGKVSGWIEPEWPHVD